MPKELTDVYLDKCGFINSTVSVVDQMIVRHFVEDGNYERHLNKTRALYKGRHDLLIKGLAPLADACRISGEHAGVHLLLTFGGKATEEDLIKRAKRAGIRVYGLSDYIIGERDEKATVLLGYANMSEEEIEEAAKILCRVWKP